MRKSLSLFVLLIILMLMLPAFFVIQASPVFAQGGTKSVQRFVGQIENGKTGVFYRLQNLKRGQMVYATVNRLSGNLDPFVAVADESRDGLMLQQDYRASVQQAIENGGDPLGVVPEISNRYFLAWDDDSGDGYNAAVSFQIPTDGDYKILVTSARSTEGSFELLVGVDAPEVLTGQAETGGPLVTRLEPDPVTNLVAASEITGTLSGAKHSTFVIIDDLAAGDTVYAFVQTTAGELAPALTLIDFGAKPLKTDNYSGQKSQAALEYTVDANVQNYAIQLDDVAQTGGDYRLLVGINAPDVLSGQADPTQISAIKKPIQVQVGIKMEQITGVDQKSENFGVVADVRMEWTDPRLAFSPDECQCTLQTLSGSAFNKYLADRGITVWPAFTLFNQQGRRDSQNPLVVVLPDGQAIYVERFSATLQAPDFDFHNFPFDRQQFHIRIKSVFPEEFFEYAPLEGFSALGSQLGEEEWVLSAWETTVDTVDNASRFNFSFDATRHLNFYIFRIFVPVLVIIVVSWITFFLKDYGKRVDVASGNLLLFIAFNFTISADLPRLGYLTFLDVILVSTFIITGLTIVFSVYLKRLEVNKKVNFAQSIDKYMIWMYPLMYVAAFGIVTYFFT